MFLVKPQYTEDLRTILAFILGMPDVTRHEFYKSVEGKNILKGIQLEAENDKSPKDSSGATRKWDKEELDKIIKQVHEASPEQREALLQLLPGPVVSMILSRIKPIDGEESGVKIVKGMGTGMPGAGGGVRGPQKGTPGYEQWKAKLQMTRAAKKKTPEPSGNKRGEGPSEKEYGQEKKMGRYQHVGVDKNQPDSTKNSRGYKHFVRQIGEHGEIHDSPAGKKTQR